MPGFTKIILISYICASRVQGSPKEKIKQKKNIIEIIIGKIPRSIQDTETKNSAHSKQDKYKESLTQAHQDRNSKPLSKKENL